MFSHPKLGSDPPIGLGRESGCDSACVEVMTTLHGSTLSLRRRVRGSIPLEGTIALTRDPFKSPPYFFKSHALTL